MLHAVQSACLILVPVLAGIATGQSTGAARVLRPIKRPAVPEVGDPAWCVNPIDRFVLRRLERASLTPAPPADGVTLTRRVSLVLLGMPPSPLEVAAFEGDDGRAAFTRLVERALASPHYGERWARHWLDLARFAETNGFETNTPRPNAWPYRDWVIDAFNRDLPFDRFMLAQVAGDAIGVDAATGFLVAGAYDAVKSPDEVLTRNQRQDELTDMVNATTTAFLGLTVACARCHDHKFDPISQRDFYGLQAIFAGVRHGERPWRQPEHEERAQRIQAARTGLAAVDADLQRLEGQATPWEPRPGLAVLDDGDAWRAQVLDAEVAELAHASGTGRGQRDDLGDPDRLPNVAGGACSRWAGGRERDLIAFAPGVSGRHDLWLSWGTLGSAAAEQVRYELDLDGDLATMVDRSLLCEVNQRRFADGSPASVGSGDAPLWSGMFHAGAPEFTPASRVVLRSTAGAGTVTADVLIVVPAIETGSARTSLRLREGVSALGNEERFAPTPATALRFVVEEVVGGSEPCIDELEVFGKTAPGAERVNLAATERSVVVVTSGDYAGNPKHRPEHLNDGQYGNDRSWISNTPGSGWVELRWEAAVYVEQVRWARDRTGGYSDRLASRYRIELKRDDGPWRRVAGSSDRLPPKLAASSVPLYRFAGLSVAEKAELASLFERRKRLQSELAAVPPEPRVYAGYFEEPETTHLLHRGDPMQRRDPVGPGVPAALGGLELASDTEDAARRLAFGRWLGARENPLPARVMVNRLWAHHFGTGLVATPSDLGVMGVPASHPDLLDWLAAELIESGWSLKHIQRLIVYSSTWRQSSQPRPGATAVDADTRLLWRFPPRRAEAEVLRDSILAVTGVLDTRAGGPGYAAFEPNTNYVRNYVPRGDFDSDGLRRMVYMTKVRMERDATFGVFDTPDAGQVCATRGCSTTPLQAMSLFNSPFVLKQAGRLAERVRAETGGAPDEQVERAFRLTLGRAPDADELTGALTLIELQDLTTLCRALFNCNEFAFIL